MRSFEGPGEEHHEDAVGCMLSNVVIVAAFIVNSSQVCPVNIVFGDSGKERP